MKRGIAIGALFLLVPAVCFADAPSRARSRAGLVAVEAQRASAPESRVDTTSRVLKVFKVFGDDDDEGSGVAPRRSVRKGRKSSRGAKRSAPRKPRLAPAPSAEPGGILELIDTCPELVKM